MKRVSVALLVLGVSVLVTAPVATAQEERNVTIEFDTGVFDPERGDWPITVVYVSGDLDAGEPVVVELRDGAGDVLWSGSATYQPPVTAISVDRFVAVGDLEEAALGQRLPPPEEEPPPIPTQPVVAGDLITRPPPAPGPAGPDDPAESDVALEPETQPGAPGQDGSTPAVAGDVVTQPGGTGVVRQGSGVGGAGQMALSMVIAVVFVAILFRTPLPSATTQRWRK